MIEAINLTKRFDDIKAVDHINAVIREQRIWIDRHEWCRKEYVSQNGCRNTETG